MKRKSFLIASLAITGMLFPLLSEAQTLTGEIEGMNLVLDRLYDEMIPLCSSLINVARGIAGFAALWYIAGRVYRQLANAEPIDVYPLLRPFAIGIAIGLFPAIIDLLNAVLRPTVSGTSALVENSNKSVQQLLAKRDQEIQNSYMWYLLGDEGASPGRLERYMNPGDEEEDSSWEMLNTGMRFYMNAAFYMMKNAIKVILSEVLHVLYVTAALCINTIRTFYLIVLAIIGPLVLGLSVFDGFQHSLTVWMARYVNVFLWLPIANLFGAIIGKVQENMLKQDISQIEKYGDSFFTSSDLGYLIFMMIGIVGYLTVPSVANYIVHAAGENSLLHKATNAFQGSVKSVGSSVNLFKSSNKNQ